MSGFWDSVCACVTVWFNRLGTGVEGGAREGGNVESTV